jgi:hypothetical protein
LTRPRDVLSQINHRCSLFWNVVAHGHPIAPLRKRSPITLYESHAETAVPTATRSHGGGPFTVSEIAVQELLDRAAIQEAVLRYCRGVDRADAELLASAYHPDAVDEHGMAHFEGDAIARGIIELVSGSRVSLHQITNQTVDLLGTSRAACESYFTAWQSMQHEGEERMLLALGRYIDQFEKRDGDWRVAHRLVIVEHAQLLPAGGPFPPASPGLGRRDRQDPSYTVLQTR